MADLEDFSDWLVRRGRDEGTAKLYVHHVRLALTHKKGYLGRLMDKSLAPKTRRTILASLRSWALFKDDPKLEKDLKDIKLPPAVRKTPKTPLERAAWVALINEIDRADYVSDATRAVLGLMATRGFRVGDVLRLTREEVGSAIESGTLGFEAKGSRRLEYRSKGFNRYLVLLMEHKAKWQRVEDIFTASDNNARKQAIANVSYALRKVAKKCGLDPKQIHPHKLRRTYATYFLKEMAGDPEGLVKLKEHMCWADLTTASGYVDHVRKDELAEIEDRLIDPTRTKK